MNIISRNTLSSLGSPLTYHRYAMTILDLPAIGITDEQICIRVLSADKPTINNEKTTIEQTGFRISYAGKDEFSDSLSFSFLSTGDGETVNALMNWKEFCNSTMMGGSVNPANYKSTILLADLAYDNETIIRTYTVYGCFPQEISFGDGYGTSVEAQTCNVTMSMDYFIVS